MLSFRDKVRRERKRNPNMADKRIEEEILGHRQKHHNCHSSNLKDNDEIKIVFEEEIRQLKEENLKLRKNLEKCLSYNN